MRVEELSVVMDFSRQVRVIFLCGLENHLEEIVGTLAAFARWQDILGMYLGSIGEFVCSQIHFSERTLPN